jgi:hypothetical protein
VSDSHNNTLGWRDGNNFVTWIWARSASRDHLLEGLRTGTLAFGNPALFEGDVMLTTADGHRMGEVVAGVDAQSRHEFQVRLSGADPTWRVIPVVSGAPVEAIPIGSATNDAEIVFEAATPPGAFVRCEIRDAAGSVVVCTNPIAFVSEAPADVHSIREASCAR